MLDTQVRWLPVEQIAPNPHQPRREFAPGPLAELAESIRRHGILQPLTVRRTAAGWELVAGERRLRAAVLAGLETVPCLEAEVDGRASALLALVENLQRKDLHYLEEAEAIAAFRERYEPVGKFENMAAPGMADLCARLKARGYVLALASSKPESLCVPICEKFGFTPSLAVVTGSPPVGDWSKADVIRETMRRLELTEAHKPEILMVGDRKFDVLGAKACGIACAGVEFFGYAAPGELAESGAVAVVRTPEELEQFILTH